MSTMATGPFDVKMVQLSSDEVGEGASLGRMSLDKVFHGDLEGTSRGEVLTALTSVKGSAVYVAIERVTATLHGRHGSFALHHTGLMNRGEQSLAIGVVPDSGTGELTGICGTMAIVIDAGKHSYTFDYELPGRA